MVQNINDTNKGACAMISRIIFIFFLLYGKSSAETIPEWPVARNTVQQCYSGWNVKISLSGGVKSTYTRNKFSELSESGTFSGAEYDAFSEDADDEGITASHQASVDLEQATSEYTGELEQDRTSNTAYIGINLSVPLYNRETRIAKREKTESAVGTMADLYSKYEGYKATVAAMTIEEKVLKRIMLDGGESAISAYYDLLADREKARALMISARRKIMVTLEGCGYVEKNRTNRKRRSIKKSDNKAASGENGIRISGTTRDWEDSNP
jgi:hypothetical protein